MAATVEAVIAALRVTLEEAQKSREALWKAESINRWVSQLPGSWSGRWRRLILKPDSSGNARRDELVAHVRAVIAFLETNRQQIAQSRKWWPLRRRWPANSPIANAPVAAPSSPSSRPVNLLRVRKPMPGIH